MAGRNPPLLLFLFFFSVSSSFPATAELRRSPLDHEIGSNGGFRRRVLLGFKETPSGSNTTFDCAPSGACVPCQYSEKSEPKYRCSETGYRIPLKCVEIKDGVKLEKQGKVKKSRSDLETSSGSGNEQTSSITGRNLAEDLKKVEGGGGSQAYITYRSCIPPVDEEKVSVLGFEGIVLFFLVAGGSVVYYRKKQTGTMPGAGRIQMNSRF